MKLNAMNYGKSAKHSIDRANIQYSLISQMMNGHQEV